MKFFWQASSDPTEPWLGGRALPLRVLFAFTIGQTPAGALSGLAASVRDD